MKSNYPRRHVKTCADAPPYVASVFDHPAFADRYTIILTGPDWPWHAVYDNCACTLGLSYYCDSPQGVSMFGAAHRDWIRTNSRYRVTWASLPEHVKAHIRSRVES